MIITFTIERHSERSASPYPYCVFFRERDRKDGAWKKYAYAAPVWGWTGNTDFGTHLAEALWSAHKLREGESIDLDLDFSTVYEAVEEKSSDLVRILSRSAPIWRG